MKASIGNQVSDRLMAQILDEEGEAGFIRAARIPRLRLGGRNGEQTITWLWEYALSQRLPGVMWTQACETMNTYWGWWRPAIRPTSSWPTHDQRIKLGLSEHPTDAAVYAVIPRPPRPALLDSLSDRPEVAQIRPIEAEQMVKSGRFFEYAAAWLLQCTPRDRRHLLAWAHSPMLRVRVWDAIDAPSAEDLQHMRTTEWHRLLKRTGAPMLTPLVIEAAWQWVRTKVADMESSQWHEELSGRQRHVVYEETRQLSDMIRRLMSHPLPRPFPPARATLWQWLECPPESFCDLPVAMQSFAWEIWSEPNIVRTQEETHTLVHTSTWPIVWSRLVTTPNLTRDDRLHLMRALDAGIASHVPGLIRLGQTHDPHLERSRCEEAARRLEYFPITDADPELFLALARISAPMQQLQMATRTGDSVLRQSILELVFQAPHETVTTLFTQEVHRPLLQYISPTMVRPLLLHSDREVRVWAAQMIGQASDVKQEGVSVTPRPPTHAVRKTVRRMM